MPAHNKHIIQRQVLEVEMENPADAFQFRNKLEEVFHEKILPGLEVLFDEIAGNNNRLIRIDQLQIDAGNISSPNWENELIDKTIQKIRQVLVLENPVSEEPLTAGEKQIKRTVKSTANNKQPEQITRGDFIEVFFFFLKTGRLPWYASNEISLEEELKTWISETFTQIKVHLKTASTDELTRLIYLANEALLDELVRLFLSHQHTFYREFIEAKHSLAKILKTLFNNQAIIKKSLYLPFFKWFPFEDQVDLQTLYATELASLLRNEFAGLYSQPAFQQTVDDIKNNSILKKVNELLSSEATPANQDQPAKDKKITNQIEDIYIENAGLILLHPFLQPFFKQIKLTTDKDQFADGYARMRAVLLTQYLVFNNQSFEEHQLILNKILCGYSPDEPIIKELDITKDEKAEATDLLQQVIQLWKKNNVQVNGTIEGLQHSFLQRPGKLVQKNKDWHLQVEQKPYDLVLSSLPWGIGIIKTPWMQGMLWVDWA